MDTLVSTEMVMRIIPETPFTFDGLSIVHTQDIVVAQHVDISAFTEAELQIRVPSGTVTTGTYIKVIVEPEGWTPEDPATSFANVIGRVSANIGTVFPFYTVLSLPNPTG